MRKSMLAVASHASTGPTHGGLSEPHAISTLAALAQPTRLAMFKLLIKHEPVGITAGVIAETVGAPHNTLSSHLPILVRAGLLRSTFAGGRRISLSGWGATAISLYQRGRWQADKTLLDHSLPKLFAQIPMHDRARAADSTMGA